jgi:hypothetical protein
MRPPSAMRFACAAIQGCPHYEPILKSTVATTEAYTLRRGSVEGDSADPLPPVSRHAGEQGLHLVNWYGA